MNVAPNADEPHIWQAQEERRRGVIFNFKGARPLALRPKRDLSDSADGRLADRNSWSKEIKDGSPEILAPS